ncbi:aromatic ring-hydroxylating dioxygenase subunit alpha [Calothrix sp. UHCC 0171]|uniref:aromatic ring-hydroxylating dioxygenase subunit alpha n=1 Tax=Calothrix sp. UHCC 0171 TaxID=3110245 RepID=UPI002B2144FA|nr:aromatic ring-hydroxylating dioxygenase subunit alpha [Calothrix sp. UHCC 0171]MEA5573350.1 aromatic ring-hydroxylating dioxygenase subunit alpha [Calothrix sp. UHCC 0171]
MKNYIYSDWYIVCTSRELKHQPIARTILEIPLVLFRGSNRKPIALLDKCPHRNVPLSQGWVRDNQIICRYHGWKFDTDGTCQEIPGLCNVRNNSKNNHKLNAISYPVIEQDNFIWVYCQVNEEPKTQPFKFPLIKQCNFSTFYWQTKEIKAAFVNIAENFLDATHTHFVHAGLIRNQNRKNVNVQITRNAKMVEAIYLGEQNISGLIYQLLAPGCQEIVSIGRFILPSIAQLEYRTNKEEYKLFISLFLTPISENLTKFYAVVTFRWGLPKWLGKLIAVPLFYIGVQQDKKILELQARNIKKFGEEDFASTEIDLIKPHISYLQKMSLCDANNLIIKDVIFKKNLIIKI